MKAIFNKFVRFDELHSHTKQSMSQWAMNSTFLLRKGSGEPKNTHAHIYNIFSRISGEAPSINRATPMAPTVFETFVLQLVVENWNRCPVICRHFCYCSIVNVNVIEEHTSRVYIVTLIDISLGRFKSLLIAVIPRLRMLFYHFFCLLAQ